MEVVLMKKINDLTYEDIKNGKVFIYLDEESNEIDEFLQYVNNLKENSGYYLITGEVTLADTTQYPAIFGISSDDGGEMFEFHFLINPGEWASNKDNLEEILNKRKEKIFP